MIRRLAIFLLTVQAACAIDLSPLEQIPIQEGGRKKPYLVFCEESLLAISGKTSLTLDGKKCDAMPLITALWLAPEGWDQKPIILVNHKGLKEELGLDPAQKRFTYQELDSNTKLEKLLGEAAELRKRPGNNKLSGLPKEAASIGLRLGLFKDLIDGKSFRFVANPDSSESIWSAPVENQIAQLRIAFLAEDSTGLDTAAQTLREQLAATEPGFQPIAWKIQLETVYQKAHPFRWAWILYAAAGIVLLVSSLGRLGYAAAWILAGSGFLFQIAGFAARISIGGRPPVTNMYESVVWVAFGTILFALIFEAIYRCRYFLLGAIPVAVVSLILADTQPMALNRAITPLVPVLRDNFWLTTHVLTITLSYAAFALSLGVAHIILAKVIRGKKPESSLYNYLYRALQVGVLLLATGTILGAVWANYSWGRFWDWDPKETWALITLLGYLIVLHGRVAGKWGGFGMAIGAVLAFQGVLMAWYGVNFVLGVGLHSYGFGTGGFLYALFFVAAELTFVTAAILQSKRNAKPPSSTEKSPDLQAVS